MPKCSKCGKSITSATMVCNECMPRWISVTERLPDDSYDFCLAALNGKVGNRTYHCSSEVDIYKGKDGKAVFVIDDEDVTHIVTHWMPLPEPPKEV